MAEKKKKGGKFNGQRSLVGYSPWSHKELDLLKKKWRGHSSNEDWVKFAFSRGFFPFILLFSLLFPRLLLPFSSMGPCSVFYLGLSLWPLQWAGSKGGPRTPVNLWFSPQQWVGVATGEEARRKPSQLFCDILGCECGFNRTK